MGSRLRRQVESAETARDLFSDAAIGLCVFDTDLRFLEVNEWLAAVHGAPVVDHIGQHVTDINIDIAFDLEPRLKSILASGKVASVVTGIMDTTAEHGSIRNFHYLCAPIRNQIGAIEGVSCVVDEITGRIHQQNERQRTEIGLQDFVSDIPAGISYFDIDACFRYANRHYRELIDIDPAELVGMHLSEALGPEAWENARKYVDRVLQGEPVKFENVVMSSNGNEAYIQASYVPDMDTDHAVIGFFAMVQDITDRKQAESSLLQANEDLKHRVSQRTAELEELNRSLENEIAEHEQVQEEFRLFLEAAPDPTIVIDANGKIDLVNSRIEGVLGYAPTELLGQPVEILIPADSRSDHARQRAAFAESPVPRMMGAGRELCAVCKDGSLLPVEISLTPARISDRDVVIAHVRDMTAEKAARDREFSLSARLLNAQEDERSRIARELHDDFSQRLALLAINLEQLQEHNQTEIVSEHTAFAEDIVALQESAHAISVDINRLSHQLHPPILDHIGLVAAVTNLISGLTALHNVEIDVKTVGEVRDIPVDVALCLYRIAQEAMWNVVRHSETKAAEVEIRFEPADIVLTVTDHGKGFDHAAAEHSQGLGLVSMRERLLLVDGSLEISSVTPNGTKLEGRVPAAAEAAKAAKAAE